MANIQHLEMLAQGVTPWNDWRKNSPGVNPDLTGANLTEAHLPGANLIKADLTEANLYKANLRRGSLERANLTNTVLIEAELEGANLSEAHLKEADLTEANLTETTLLEADLERANLTRANLTGANLSAANLFGTNLSEANLEKAVLAGASLERANLEKAKLPGANVKEADLTEANLIKADLTEANLEKAVLARAVLAGAKLSRAGLTEANLIKADLTEADLTGANLTGAVLFKANIAAAVYDKEAFKDADVQGISPQDISASVEIYLPQEDIPWRELEALQTAIDEFMEVCGFELQTQLEPRYGSYWQRLKFWSKEKMTPHDVDAIYEQGKAALSAAYLGKPAAEVTDKFADAAVKLIKALEPYENGALRLGDILVVKVTRHGECFLRAETMTPELAHALAGNPLLLQRPEDVINRIGNQQRSLEPTLDKERSEETPLELDRQTSHSRLYPMKLFISHSSQDVKIVQVLIDLLRSALSLRAGDIRCTSVDGYRLPGGAHIEDQLRAEVNEAEAFIGLISAAGIQSVYVAFELGARWGARRHLLPLLAPGAPTHLLTGPLQTLNALRADSASQLHQLVQDIGCVLKIQSESPAAYQNHIDAITSIAQKHYSLDASKTPSSEQAHALDVHSVDKEIPQPKVVIEGPPKHS